jgi:hypothetical protein
MTTLTQPGEMAIAPDLISMPFMSVGEAEMLSALGAARIAPEQVAGAYSLLQPRRQNRRPHFGHTFFGRGRSGLFFPK